MKLRHLSLAAAICLLASTLHAQDNKFAEQSASAADHMTEEEAAVRRAYAKLAFLTQFTVYSKAAISVPAEDPVSVATKAKELQVDFTLSDFKSGPISEIGEISWGQIVSAPRNDERVLNFHLGSYYYQYHESPRVFWRVAEPFFESAPQYSEDVRAEVLAFPVRKILELGASLMNDPDAVYTRYATYQVTYTFQHITVGPYKALFFFGANTHGQPAIASQDLYVNAGALFLGSHESLYPADLLRSRARGYSLLADFLNASQIDPKLCTARAGDLCCTATRCGFSQIDLQRDLSIPLAASQQ